MSESRSRRDTETESSIEVVQIDGLVRNTCLSRTFKKEHLLIVFEIVILNLYQIVMIYLRW